VFLWPRIIAPTVDIIRFAEIIGCWYFKKLRDYSNNYRWLATIRENIKTAHFAFHTHFVFVAVFTSMATICPVSARLSSRVRKM